MQVLHAPAALSAVFDNPMVSCAGLAPVVALAAGLAELTTSHVRVPGEQGANPGLKVAALVAGMVGGADSIGDMDLLRRDGSAVRRGAGAVDVGHVPAQVHVRPCPSARHGRLPAVGRLIGQAQC